MKTQNLNIKITKYLKVNIWFLPILISAFWGGYIKLFLLTYAIALLHELSHVLCAHILKVPISNITIYPFGICARLSNGYIKSSEKEFLIAFSGPFFNIVLVVILAFLNQFSPQEWLIYCMDVSFLMCLINMVPSLPLDGGRMLKSILTARFGILRAYNFMLKVSRIVIFFLFFVAILLLVISHFNFSLILISAFLLQNICSEQKAVTLITLREILRNKDKPKSIQNMPSKTLCVSEKTPARTLLNLLTYDRYYVIHILDSSNKIKKTVTETEVISNLIENGIRIKYRDI